MNLLNSTSRQKLIPWFSLLLVMGLNHCFSGLLHAQLPNQKPALPGASKTQSNKQKIGKPPEPEEVILETKDHVKLVCTYLGPPESEDGELGKTTIPFILLHDWEGNRRQLHLFGAFLQNQGHAVIIPDFRGHGASTAVAGRDKPIKFERFRKNDIASATLDIERCKKFLVKRNNEGKLNIDLLCVVAIGKSSALAAEWTLTDWFEYSSVNKHGIKQGQDVRSLILVSPRKKLGALTLLQSFKNPLFSGASGNPLPLMIVWCPGDDKSAKDSKSLIGMLEKTRPDPSQSNDTDDGTTQKSLFIVPVKKETLSAVDLMNTERIPGLWNYIATTMSENVMANVDKHPWKTREKPKEDE